MAIGKIRITINPAQAAQANIVRGRLSRADRIARRSGAEIQAQSYAAKAVRMMRSDGRPLVVSPGEIGFERLERTGVERIEIPWSKDRKQDAATESALRAAFLTALTAQNTLEGLRAISAVEIAGATPVVPAKAAPLASPAPARVKAAAPAQSGPAKAQAAVPELKYKMSVGQMAAVTGVIAFGLASLGFIAGAATTVMAIELAIGGAAACFAIGIAFIFQAVSETKENRANYRGEGILEISNEVFTADQRRAIKKGLIELRVGSGSEVFFQRADSTSMSSDGYWTIARETRKGIEGLLAVDRAVYGPVLCETATTRVVFFAYQTSYPYGKVPLLELGARRSGLL